MVWWWMSWMCFDFTTDEERKDVRGRALYNEARNHFKLLKWAKKETWWNAWREFWSSDPREVWHFIHQLMGKSGSECECAPDEISRHFCDVGTPPDDPDFCLDSSNEAKSCIETYLQSGTEAAQMADLSGDPHFSSSEVSEEFSKLNNSALGLDGLSKNIIFPILSIISPAVASLSLLFCGSLSHHLIGKLLF